MKTITRILLSTAFIALLALPSFGAATIVIINTDGPNEGFNDQTPVAPVGGNTGTTRGQQRLIAFAHAASIWAETLDSNVEIRVNAQFSPLGANVLGSAGSIGQFANFTPVAPYPGPLFADTWYSTALANKRAGRDLNTATSDITANFSSDFDFYLGLDANHGAQNDLVAVLLHELGHGLGFQNFVNEANGQNQLSGGNRFTDVYSQFTLDITNGLTWTAMTAAQRQASAINAGKVGWTGPTVTAAAPSVLSLGSPFITIGGNKFEYGTAAFGPAPHEVPVAGNVVYANDGIAAPATPTTAAGTVNDGCEAFAAGSLAGKVALIDRGVCAFVIKARNAQDAGAIGVIIGNNTLSIPSMAGTDAAMVIPTISISLSAANTLRGLLPTAVASGLESAVYAGATPGGLVRLYMPAVVEGGSSGSHYDNIARRNLLMEPSINPDLTHSLAPPEDLTLPLMRDIGWFADADTEGIEDAADNCPNAANVDQANYDADSQGDACDSDDDNDGVNDSADANPFSNIRATVLVGQCESGAPNLAFPTGLTLMDRLAALGTQANHGQFVSAVSALTNEAKALGLITGAQKGAIEVCAARK